MAVSSVSDTSLSDAVTRWFTDPAARQDPWSLYEQLRREDAVHYCEPLDTWVLTRYADVNKVLRFPRAHITPMAGKNTAGVRDARVVSDAYGRSGSSVARHLARYAPGELDVRRASDADILARVGCAEQGRDPRRIVGSERETSAVAG